MTDETDKQRLNDLEIAFAHQDGQIRDLSEMVEKQWKEIDRLKIRLDHALNKLSEMETSSSPNNAEKSASSADDAAANKPPHY